MPHYPERIAACPTLNKTKLAVTFRDDDTAVTHFLTWTEAQGLVELIETFANHLPKNKSQEPADG